MKTILLNGTLGCFISAAALAAGFSDSVSEAPSPDSFALFDHGKAATIVVGDSETAAVKRAAGDLAADIEHVTGHQPLLVNNAASAKGAAIIIQTKASPQWESYALDAKAGKLTITGSDRRGTIYGIYSLSEAIGVSPWVWWADVPAQKHARLFVKAGAFLQKPPAVKYRGIFLNDEDWGLQPWAAKTFDPQTKDIGPKTYAKVFELLLRLKANTLWPAMHSCTHAFNFYPQDKVLADEYGIVMGSSHCEQMLRDNVDEWKRDGKGDYNYVTNRAGVRAYWEQRVKENGQYENSYTMGMRGIHDGAMPGGGTLEEKAARLSQIITDQRELLRKWVNPHPELVPQILCPYKEVLPLYQRMSPPPEDITLVWPDDNFGFVRQFSNAREQKRSGGAGVYYHVSYYGAPQSYLWLCTTPPALIEEEMTKAFDYGANTFWMLNVGDLKPAEWDMTFFLQLAWNPHPHDEAQIWPEALEQMAARAFGKPHADEITAIMREYYRLNGQRKPEHMTADDEKHPQLGAGGFEGAEITQRLADFAKLQAHAEALATKLPKEMQDAYFELVLYPVRGSAQMNMKALNFALSEQTAQRGDGGASAKDYALAQKAQAVIQADTKRYNEEIAGGKWRNIMSSHPQNLAVFGLPSAPVVASQKVELPRKSDEHTISIEAENFTAQTKGRDAHWRVLDGLGTNGQAMAVAPVNVPVLSTPEDIRRFSPKLSYRLTLPKAGDVQVSLRCLPTWSVQAEQPQRVAIALDAGAPVICALPRYGDEHQHQWQEDVVRMVASANGKLSAPMAGAHTLQVWMVDPGIVLDEITIHGETPQ